MRQPRDQRRPYTKALLLSGDTSTAIHELSGTFACRLLSKPVDVTVLSEAITQLLDPQSIN